MVLSSIVLDCSDAKSLATFYENLLGWEMKVYNHGENERIG